MFAVLSSGLQPLRCGSARGLRLSWHRNIERARTRKKPFSPLRKEKCTHIMQEKKIHNRATALTEERGEEGRREKESE